MASFAHNDSKNSQYHPRPIRIATYGMMLRSCPQVRTALQLGSILFLLTVFIFFLDSRYNVLPDRIHTLSPTHHSGYVVTDITVASCSSVSLLSSCTLDSDWHRIEKDLYLGKAWVSHAYVHVQRKKEEELEDTDEVVLDVRIGRNDPTVSEKEQGDLKWERRPGGIWLRRSARRHASDSQKAVTAVDVLFGSDAVDPRLGWQVKDLALLLNVDRDAPEPRLSIRHGQPKDPHRPQPRLRNQGRFKILQVTDMHLSTGLGKCRDEYPSTPHCDADPRTLEFVSATLDSEKPDLVVLSGDVVNGETAPDAQTALFKMAEPFVKRQIPYALIFGNHDDEGSLSRGELMAWTTGLPYSLSEAGPATVDGVGNYVVEVLAGGTSHNSALTLYLLDTHAYSPDEAHYKGYDWIKPSQIAWFRETARALRNQPAHKGYAHRRLDMAFIHIPLPEYRDSGNLIPGAGEWREPPTAPGFNSHFADALLEHGVFGVSAGHDHVNDYCVLEGHSDPKAVEGDEDAKKRAEEGKLWACYGGACGYGGYGGYGGYKRRIRVWDFDFTDAKVETWKRVDGEDGKKDVKRVVARGKVLERE